MTTAPKQVPPEPVVLDGLAGPVFAIHWPGHRSHDSGYAVIYLPPFAEELNRARRMAALQAQMLAAAGIGMLALDPYGCGDSGGDFRDARWETWLDDAVRAVAWMRARGYGSITLLGLRLGALLALAVAATTRISRVMLWNPVLRGDQMITQFLRLRLAADLSGGKKGESTSEMRQALAKGDSIEIAGYELSGELVSAIDTLRVADLGAAITIPIDWIDVVPTAGQSPPPAHEQVMTKWRTAGTTFTYHQIAGEPFWNLQETTIAPDLLKLTAHLLESGRT